MSPITITLPPKLFSLVLSGKKRIIGTRRNPRKDRFFKSKTPDMAKGEYGQFSGEYINNI